MWKSSEAWPMSNIRYCKGLSMKWDRRNVIKWSQYIALKSTHYRMKDDNEDKESYMCESLKKGWLKFSALKTTTENPPKKSKTTKYKDIIQVQKKPGRSLAYILPSLLAATLMNIPRWHFLFLDICFVCFLYFVLFFVCLSVTSFVAATVMNISR